MRDLTKENPFGRWTVLRKSDRKNSQGAQVYWVCKCECGKIRDVLAGNLTKGESLGCQSCCKVKYPWDEWLSGQIISVDAQAEYGRTPQVFRTNLYKKAKDNGLVVNTEIDGNRITFHFRKPSDQQIIAAHGGRR